MTGDDMPQGLTHLGVLCSRDPCIGYWYKKKHKEILHLQKKISEIATFLIFFSVVTSAGLALGDGLRLVHAYSRHDRVGGGEELQGRSALPLQNPQQDVRGRAPAVMPLHSGQHLPGEGAASLMLLHPIVLLPAHHGQRLFANKGSWLSTSVPMVNHRSTITHC